MKNGLPTSKSASQFNPTSNGYHSDLTFDAVAAHYGQSGRHIRLSTSVCHGGNTAKGLVISRAENGGILASCKSAGCAFTQICDGLRLDMGLPPFESARRNGAERFWMVSGPADKQFRHCRKDPSSGKQMWWDPPPSAYGVKTSELIYRTGDLENVHAVICEGEKASDAVKVAVPDVRVIGTVGGKGVLPTAETIKWALSGGVQKVTLWADEDDGGRTHMLGLASLIQKNLPGVKILWVSTQGLREKDDAADVPSAERVRRIDAAQGMVWSSEPVTGAPLTPEVPGVASPPRGASAVESVPLSEVVAVRPVWLVEPWISKGNIHSLEGKKAVGKSQLLLWLTGQFCKRHAKGKVIYFTFEDDPAVVIKPRAEAAGLDLSRLVVVSERLTLADTDRIRAHIEKHDARLVFFDTLQKYVPNSSADFNSVFASQGALTGIETLARSMGVGVVVTRHARKGAVADASEAGSGSAGIAGAMRTILTAGRIGKELALALAVSNYAPPDGGFYYELKGVKIQVSDGITPTSFVKILREDSTLDAGDITDGGANERQKTDGEFAEEWFRETYAGETKAFSDVLQAACRDEDAVFKYPTLKKVLKKLGWKAGPKEAHESHLVGAHRGVWLAPEKWAEIENELPYHVLSGGGDGTEVPGQRNQLFKPIEDGKNGTSVLSLRSTEVLKQGQNGVRQIENGCPTHGKSAMPSGRCLVEGCTHDERSQP